MTDRQRLSLPRRPAREGRQRNQVAGCRRADVDLVETLRVALYLRRRLHDDVITILLREILRQLTLPECVVERVVDGLGRQAIARRLIAIDIDRQGRARHLLVRRHVAEIRKRLQLFEQLWCPSIELPRVGVLQRVLELRSRRPASNIDVLRRLSNRWKSPHRAVVAVKNCF